MTATHMPSMSVDVATLAWLAADMPILPWESNGLPPPLLSLAWPSGVSASVLEGEAAFGLVLLEGVPEAIIRRVLVLVTWVGSADALVTVTKAVDESAALVSADVLTSMVLSLETGYPPDIVEEAILA